MAVTEVETLTPIMPERGAIVPSRVRFSYDRPSDTLYVQLHGPTGSAVSVDAGPHLYLQTKLESQEVVGLQIEHYLLRVVREQPAFLEIAELAGVPAAEVAEIRNSLSLDVRRRAAVDTVFSQLPALSYAAGGTAG